ncbi:aldo/keto reductase [endosymbiont GvMRE of Glomus versiforme]|uniref:aldo/keto reductase n=1 Tax=endosymbiont GvMRE of Glomus versiforme TaxID=2039283 RepID=UPI000EC47E8A|nr:aldo/keto reductase [endosymbiont GvMRE of Glomus versiforme]RHZ37019.1 Aldo/keto reductase [endosymbiont GvMRE of Glomus versiforme]
MSQPITLIIQKIIIKNHQKIKIWIFSKKKIALSNGIIIPLFGLGSWNLTNYQRDKQAVQYALQQEYRLIDSAQMYNNEKMIGQAVKDSGVPRQEVFLVSKLNTHQCEYNTAKKTIDQMLANFQTDYLDLCLIHWPVPQKRLEAWKALEEAYREGKLKAIGVSNFEPKHLDELLANCEIKPMVNQIELHPAFRQNHLLPYVKFNNF